MIKAYILSLCLILTLLHSIESQAYSMPTHKIITQKVIDQNITTLSGYLEDIDLNNGLDEYVGKKRVREWIEDGSYYEDYNWSFVWG